MKSSLKVVSGSGISEARFANSLRSLLDDNHVLTLATVNDDGSAHINNAYFAVLAQFDLVIWTSPRTAHALNVGPRPSVAISICDSRQVWGSDMRGVQLFGEMSQAGVAGSLRGFKAYADRFVGLKALASSYRDVDRAFESRFYVFRARRIKIIDEASFGKEEYVEARVGQP